MTETITTQLNALRATLQPSPAQPGLSEVLYRAFIQQTLDAIYIYDAQTKRLLETNQAFLDLLGYSAAEARRLTVNDIVDLEPARASVTLHFQEIIVSGREGLSERIWRRKDGARLEVQVTATPLQHEERQLVFVAGRDVTERKRAEQRSHELYAQLKEAHAELTSAYETTLEGLAKALELRDKETEGHTQRVAEVAVQLARAMRVPENEITHLRRGALLHDIGKIGVPDSVLRKPGPLTMPEMALMRKHPEYAYELISAIEFLFPAIDIPYCHHEKWDGSGYPRRLQGVAIPLAARIFAVVDVWDALSSDRPYREAWPSEQVIEHIRSLSGSHFDPAVVTAFLKLLGV
jgi:PAS domain S-box-containing protein